MVLLSRDPVDGGFEVVVFSDGSTDGTDESLRSTTPRSRCEPSPGRTRTGRGRDRGIGSAEAELVVFLDDNVVPDPELVAAHLAPVRRSLTTTSWCRSDGHCPRDSHLSPWVRSKQRMLYKQYEAMQRGDGRRRRGSSTAATRRSLGAICSMPAVRPGVPACRGCRAGLPAGTAGAQLTFDPAAIVTHYAERSYEAWLAAAYAYGRNDVVFGRDRGQAWLLDAISNEFHRRHRLVRTMTSWLVPHPRAARATSAVLSCVARSLGWLPQRWCGGLTSATLSAVYNLTYYCGMADELGSGRQLLARFYGASST